MDEHRHKKFVTLMFFMVVQHVIVVVALQLALHQWLFSLSNNKIEICLKL
jgi:hypothetical protein